MWLSITVRGTVLWRAGLFTGAVSVRPCVWVTGWWWWVTVAWTGTALAGASTGSSSSPLSVKNKNSYWLSCDLKIQNCTNITTTRDCTSAMCMQHVSTQNELSNNPLLFAMWRLLAFWHFLRLHWNSTWQCRQATTNSYIPTCPTYIYRIIQVHIHYIYIYTIQAQKLM